MASAGMVMLTVGAGMLASNPRGLATLMIVRSPTPVLITLISHVDSGWYLDVAASELARRIGRTEVSAEQRKSYADELLVRIEDRSRPFPGVLGDALWAMLEAGTLDEAQAERYWGQYFSDLVVTSPKRLRVGQVFALSTSDRNRRLGTTAMYRASTSDPHVRVRSEELQIRSTDPAKPATSSGYFPTTHGWNRCGLAEVTRFLTSPDLVGPAFIDLKLGLAVDRWAGNGEIALEHAYRQPVEIVPADQPVITINADSSLEPALQRALRADTVNIVYQPGIGTLGSHYVVASIDGKDLPIDVGFVSTLTLERADGVKVEIAGETHSSRVSNTVYGTYISTSSALHDQDAGAALRRFIGDDAGMIERMSGATARLHLRTSILAAEKRPDVETIWSGEIEFTGLPVVVGETMNSWNANGTAPTSVKAGPPIADAPYATAPTAPSTPAP